MRKNPIPLNRLRADKYQNPIEMTKSIILHVGYPRGIKTALQIYISLFSTFPALMSYMLQNKSDRYVWTDEGIR